MDGEGSEPTQELDGREALTPVFDDLNRYEATTHFNGQSTIALDGDRATGESYCLAHHLFTEDGERKLMVASLRYLDTFVKIDGTWLFAERNLYVDWTETRRHLRSVRSGQRSGGSFLRQGSEVVGDAGEPTRRQPRLQRSQGRAVRRERLGDLHGRVDRGLLGVETGCVLPAEVKTVMTLQRTQGPGRLDRERLISGCLNRRSSRMCFGSARRRSAHDLNTSTSSAGRQRLVKCADQTLPSHWRPSTPGVVGRPVARFACT